MVGLVAVGSMALAACSDDDDRLTRAELAAQGDAVCNRLGVEVKKLASQFDATIIFPPEQMQELYTKMVPLVDRAIADLKALEPPKDLEAKYAAATAQMAKDRQTLVAATESPASAKKLYDGQVDPFAATGQRLTEVGITACSDEGAQGDAGQGAGAGDLGNDGPTTTTDEATVTTSSTTTAAP